MVVIVIVAAASRSRHRVRQQVHLKVPEIIGGLFPSISVGLGRQKDRSSFQCWNILRSDLRYFFSVLSVLALFGRKESNRRWNEIRVFDHAFCAVSSLFRWVYDLLDNTLDQQLQDGKQTMIVFSVLDHDAIEHLLCHHFFVVNRNSGSCGWHKDRITRQTSYRALIESLTFFFEGHRIRKVIERVNMFRIHACWWCRSFLRAVLFALARRLSTLAWGLRKRTYSGSSAPDTVPTRGVRAASGLEIVEVVWGSCGMS